MIIRVCIALWNPNLLKVGSNRISKRLEISDFDHTVFFLRFCFQSAIKPRIIIAKACSGYLSLEIPVRFFGSFLKHTFAKAQKKELKKMTLAPNSYSLKKKHVSIPYENQSYFFGKSALSSIPMYFSRTTVIEHVFTKKKHSWNYHTSS